MPMVSTVILLTLFGLKGNLCYLLTQRFCKIFPIKNIVSPYISAVASILVGSTKGYHTITLGVVLITILGIMGCVSAPMFIAALTELLRVISAFAPRFLIFLRLA